ncbi:hypothetical protein MMC17_003256 [Xylographa soralifera]|nr:hypothetical protein [Xylographa soralifera]
MKYTLVYSEHDKELKTIFSSVPEFTRARRYTKKDIRTIRGDKALYLTWERMIPDLLYPDGLQTNVACNVWLDVPAFKKLGDTVAKDWEFRRIDCIWVDQHYPCPECDNSVKAKCLEDLTDG